MKISHASHTLLQVLIAINLSFYVTISRSIINVQAQQQGCIVPGRGSNAAFAPNSKLTVYLDPSYTEEQRNAVMSGLTAWTNNNGSTGNSSGIVIDHWIIGSPPNPMPTNSIAVVSSAPLNTSGQPTGGRAITSYVPGPVGGYKTSAVITIDPHINSPAALQEVADHEGGHAFFGLMENTAATSPSSSIMAYSPPCSSSFAVSEDPGCGGVVDWNALRHLSAPTDCDQQSAKQNGGYGTPNTAQPNPPASSGSGSRQDQSFWTGNYQNRSCYQWFQVTYTIICSGSRGCTVFVDYQAFGSPMCY